MVVSVFPKTSPYDKHTEIHSLTWSNIFRQDRPTDRELKQNSNLLKHQLLGETFDFQDMIPYSADKGGE